MTQDCQKVAEINQKGWDFPNFERCVSCPLTLGSFQPMVARRDRSQTLVGGPGGKVGALKVLKLLRGPWKNDHKFSWENLVYMIFCGLTHKFYVKRKKKRGGAEIFEVWKRGAKNFAMAFFWHRGPPASVCERSLGTFQLAQYSLIYRHACNNLLV